MTRFLHRILRLLLALTLGLGPLGTEVLAAGLHAPLCACAGCGPADEGASCCAQPEGEASGARLVAPDAECPCALTRPTDAPRHALGARTQVERDAVRSELARGQCAPAPAWSSAPRGADVARHAGEPPGPRPRPSPRRARTSVPGTLLR